ncbi:MAG: hypothetical protein ACR2N5_05670, partial [Solirubrobacterales bacterium]
ALENLERSVELARQSDPREAVRALLTLGSHLELSEASSDAEAAYSEALQIAQEIGDLTAQVELHAALARLAARRADWTAAERACEESAALIEREGLVSLEFFPDLISGMLSWRDGDSAAAIERLNRTRELGEAAARIEVVFPALILEGWVYSGIGKHSEADDAFAAALEVCERSGLTAQAVEATAARAVNLALADRASDARDAADEAEHLADRLAGSVGQAAILDARGASSESPAAGAVTFAEARDRWQETGRPVEAARSELLRAWQLARAGDEAATESSAAAIAAFEEHGFSHMAERAHELIG